MRVVVGAGGEPTVSGMCGRVRRVYRDGGMIWGREERVCPIFNISNFTTDGTPTARPSIT